MNHREIKQMQRSILYRKLTRLARLYGQNITDTLYNLGVGLIIAVGLSTPFVLAGLIQ